MKAKLFLSAIPLFFLVITTQAKVILPVVLSNGMVLQRNTEVAIGGTSATKKEVVATTLWNGKPYQIKPSSVNCSVKVVAPEEEERYSLTLKKE